MESEFLSAGFLSALFAIVLIDLVLAGDNALIIGLVARNLPKTTQRRVIFWGTFGAIAVRAVMAILVVYILDLPGFMLAGGLALVWIARKLLTPEEQGSESHLVKGPATSFAGAIRTIVIADAVMGIDNVLAIGGAASGSVLLIVLGLAISVPIIVWGSQLVIRLVDRFPSVVLLGGAVLAWTGYSMVVREPLLASWFAGHPATKLVAVILIFSISLAPWYTARMAEQTKPLVVILPGVLVWLLGFEIAGSVWTLQMDYLRATETGEYVLEAVRWLGWLPLVGGLPLAARTPDAAPRAYRSRLTERLPRASPPSTTGSMRAKLSIALGLCLSLTAEAHAQAPGPASDMAYCAELSALYRRYLGNTGQGKTFPDVSAAAAIDQCERGNTAEGIPVLEKKLRDARFTLPKRG